MANTVVKETQRCKRRQFKEPEGQYMCLVCDWQWIRVPIQLEHEEDGVLDGLGRCSPHSVAGSATRDEWPLNGGEVSVQ